MAIVLEEGDNVTSQVKGAAKGTPHYENSAYKATQPAAGPKTPSARRPFTSNWPAGLIAVLTLAFVSFSHFAGLYTFTKGFLLSRQTLETRSQCLPQASTPCTLQPSHSKAIIIVIDALRYDFLLPNNGQVSDLVAHNQLTLPAQLTKNDPSKSLMYHFVADPPTTTLQRLKAIVTGSLPTFIDMGSNFASMNAGLEEDNWVEQLSKNGKVIGFAGDDTWIGLVGDTKGGGPFQPHITFPFPSFDVEDLDTVDTGVENSLLPLITSPSVSPKWDVLIGHFLGLDHAGHRFGASHPTISAKLQQYQNFLQKTVDAMDDDTLLVVMGDHGMDAKGDHGGDAFLEVSSALWLYSKTRPLQSERESLPDWALDETDYINLGPDFGRVRTVAQTALAPTLSLIMGLSIPFSNLGSIIPEVFFRSSLDLTSALSSSRGRKANTLSASQTLVRAMQINSAQIMRYLNTYAGSPDSPGQDLAPYLPSLVQSYSKATSADSAEGQQLYEGLKTFNSEALEITRAIWARFNPELMLAGILILLLSILCSLKLIAASQWTTAGTGSPLRILLQKIIIGSAVGGGAGFAATFISAFESVSSLVPCLIGASAAGVLVVLLSRTGIMHKPSTRSKSLTFLGCVPLVIHAACFASNSFVVWEDKVVVWLLFACVCVPIAVVSFEAPQGRLRSRLLVFSAIIAVCSRLMATSTICREEQAPFCGVTFYGSAVSSIAPAWVMAASIPAAIFLPLVFAWFLGFSDSYRGVASMYFGGGFRLCLLLGVQYWISDYSIAKGNFAEAPELSGTGSWAKTFVAKLDYGICVLGGSLFWYFLPLCLDVDRDEKSVEVGSKPKITVIGFANSYGSAYLMFYAAAFSILFLITQPAGQLVMCLGMIATLALVEVNDSLNDVKSLRQAFVGVVTRASISGNVDSIADIPVRNTVATPSFRTMSGLALLSYIMFFATGHQATFPSIQWKVAFVGFNKVTYPWSPLLVILNTFGPFILGSLAVPLFVLWNFSPILPQGKDEVGKVPLTSEMLQASLKFSLYHSVLALSGAVWAGHFRRHLMVWKVFAPRFMVAGANMIIVDLTLTIFALGWGGLGTISKVRRAFRTQSV